MKNLSSEPFTEEELNVLNRGLNFAVPPKHLSKIDLVADIECEISEFSEREKENVQQKTVEAVKFETTIKQPPVDNTIKSLREKDVFCTHMRAAKGTTVITIREMLLKL